MYAFPASQQQTCNNNTDTLNHIQLAQCQINMRSGKTSDMLFLNDLDPFRSDAATTSNLLHFGQTRIMDFGGARQAAGVRLLGLQRWGPPLLKGGDSVTSVPYSTQPYCLLSPTGPSVVQGPTYRPPSLIHSSLDLLSSLHTPICPQTLCWF